MQPVVGSPSVYTLIEKHTRQKHPTTAFWIYFLSDAYLTSIRQQRNVTHGQVVDTVHPLTDDLELDVSCIAQHHCHLHRQPHHQFLAGVLRAFLDSGYTHYST